MEGFWVSADPPGSSHVVLPLAIIRFDKSATTSALVHFSRITGFATGGDPASGFSPRLPACSRLESRSRMSTPIFIPSSKLRVSSEHIEVGGSHRQRLMAARICVHFSCVTLATFSRFRKSGQGLKGRWSFQLLKTAWKLQAFSGKRPRVSGLSRGTAGSADKAKWDSGNLLWKAAVQEESHNDSFSAKVLAEPVLVENHEVDPLSNGSEFAKVGCHLEHLGLELVERAKCLDHLGDGTEAGLLDLIELLQSVGLTTPTIALMFTKIPSLVKVDAERVKQVVEFLFALKLDKDDIADVLSKFPHLTEVEIGNMRKVSQYLRSIGILDIVSLVSVRPQVLTHPCDVIEDILGALISAGVPLEDLERIMKKAPELFSAVTQNNLKPKLAFLTDAGLKGSSLGKAIARRPNILNFPLERMHTTAAYLQSMMGEKMVSKLIRRYAEVLVLDPRKKMFPVVNYLLHLGVKPEDLGKVILRRPQLLGYTLNGMQPTVDYLLKLGVQERMLGKVITISPQVLTLNVEDKLKPVVEFFRINGLNRERDMELLLTRNAQILCCSIDQNLRPKFNFLTALGLAKDEIANMIVLFPSMLGQSIEGSLVPKSNFLVHVMNRPVNEVVDFPQYFGYSLEKRIKPRHEKLVEKGIHPSLASMLACVDADFEIRYIIGNPPNRAPYRSRKRDKDPDDSLVVVTDPCG